MELEELQLNRYLYRSNQYPTADSSLLSPTVTSPGGGGSNGQANSIATGTIIQTSPSPNRVEMNPDDTLRAYNNGVVVVQIDKNGIATTTPIIYLGQAQPIAYTGFINGATGAITNGPPGWTSVRLAAGRYQITHGLGLASPFFRLYVSTPVGPAILFALNISGNVFQIGSNNLGGVGADADMVFLAMRYLP